MWESVSNYWGEITAVTTVLDALITFPTLIWILSIKKDSMSAIAWCLLVLLIPFVGALAFVVFGYQRVHRPLSRKTKHRTAFWSRRQPFDPASEHGKPSYSWAGMARLAWRLDAFPVAPGNSLAMFHDGPTAHAEILDSIRDARHHVHLEYFIIQPDATGQALFDLLAEKARNGVGVRVLYDAMGSYRLTRRMIRQLRDVGGKCEPFLPLLNPLRRRTQINLRNHRKILIVDGRIGFTGGLNIGDEYLGKDPEFGYWRDTHLRIEGPAVADLQRVFVEDWDFAEEELLDGEAYFPKLERVGDVPIQVIQSGPDQQLKSIREVYFAAIMRARKRLWIASPYCVPDPGLRDALCLAARMGVDVRFLGLKKPDKWLPFLAGRYYWTDMLAAGVKVYQYTRGMMHSKVVLADGVWASVGTANFDNRSLLLNFEVNCLIYSAEEVANLEAAFRNDLNDSEQIDPKQFAKRPFVNRLAENFCRLLSPVL